ncbi:hypothetical protein GCM10010363_61030 [Streptomyces omiyaensis]|uniref:hypothetical protein n=1 Tax=Streptomyces omiyaensis TaxID=68247 RepID=UPI0016721489|nr:hypothetical protein [Streptomyces omiyaensis]GGY71476.1 hypothetical protein GCM10010363_61030 [Streptomyces omiyaensis]
MSEILARTAASGGRFSPFTRCPSCDLVTQPDSAEYATRGDGTVDWTVAARVRCAACGHRHAITLADVLPATTTHTCVRCATESPCPAAAARMVCPGCGLSNQGPATAYRTVADQLLDAEYRHALEQQARLNAAKQAHPERAAALGLSLPPTPASLDRVRVPEEEDEQVDAEVLPVSGRPAGDPAPEAEDEVVEAELVEDGPVDGAGEVAAHDPAAAVLAAMNKKAAEKLYNDRPHKTKTGYARDWALWVEFHQWLEQQTGVRLQLSDIDVGTFVGFVTWLDEIKEAAPSSIERRVTGVCSEARRYGYTVPKEARAAATQALKPLKLDEERQKRGRGKAAAITPADLKKMNTAPVKVQRPTDPAASRSRVLVVPELARLRDRALHTLRFAVAGRNGEMSKLDDSHIRLVAEGLEVHVPSVKGRPARDVVVAYGENLDTCPVRCWNAWLEAKLAAGAAPDGPAFLGVDQWGNLSTKRLSPDGCGRALTRSAKYAGLTGRRITGHSARRGLVTTGRRKDKRVEKLRTQGGWAKNSPVFWEYVDEGDKWEDNATEGIGL